MSQPNKFCRKYVYNLFIYSHDKKLLRKFRRIDIMIKSERHINEFFSRVYLIIYIYKNIILSDNILLKYGEFQL